MKIIQQAMFEEEPQEREPFTGKATPRHLRAIKTFCEKGYRVMLSAHPTYHFQHKLTGDEIVVPLAQLLSDYDLDRKEAAKAHARDRRQRLKRPWL